jgi:hypothetical protein
LARAGYLSSFARTRLPRAAAPATLIALLSGCGSHAPPPAPHPPQVGVGPILMTSFAFILGVFPIGPAQQREE